MVDLYEYQKMVLGELLTHLAETPRALIVLASGLGKTVVSAHWTGQNIARGRCLYLSHQNEILAQSMTRFKEVLVRQNLSFGLFTGVEKNCDEVSVLFATFQTMRDWKTAFYAHEFSSIIIDEAHHGEARTYKEVIEYFQPELLLAMTATPDRTDGKDITDIFGGPVVEISLEEGIARGWLTPVEYHVLSDHLSTKALRELCREVVEEGKRVSRKQLNETIFIDRRDEEIAAKITGYPGRGIVFCESITHAENFARFLPDSAAYHSGNSAKANAEIISGFRAGFYRYILVRDMFNEGIDIPDVDVVVFLRSTDSKTVFLQQLGRGLRLSPGKEQVTVLDFVANCDRVAMVQMLEERVKAVYAGLAELDRHSIHVHGVNFRFDFDDELVDAIEVIRQIQQRQYISDIPHLLAEYDREKNSLPPEQVLAGSSRPQFWWICSKCGHPWQQRANHRVNGVGCPACANMVVTEHNNLCVTHPHLAAEYDLEKNELPPEKVLASTGDHLWWRCLKNGHSWPAIGAHRVRGSGCPFCSGRLPSVENNLTITHPHLAAEYDLEKNELPPEQILAGTDKVLWWKCKNGHSWDAKGYCRSRKSDPRGCPYCSGKRVTPDNNMAVTHPHLAAEYDREKNELPPDKIHAFTKKVLFWKCSEGHSWEKRGKDRARHSRRGCPLCWKERRKK